MSRNKGAQPLRTCIVCRRRIAKARLHRYVWDHAAGAAVLDRRQTRPGRGAYCCLDERCRERFLGRKQGWKRAFRLS